MRCWFDPTRMTYLWEPLEPGLALNQEIAKTIYGWTWFVHPTDTAQGRFLLKPLTGRTNGFLPATGEEPMLPEYQRHLPDWNTVWEQDKMVTWVMSYGFQFRLDHSPADLLEQQHAEGYDASSAWGCFFTHGWSMLDAGHRDSTKTLAIIGAALDAVRMITTEQFLSPRPFEPLVSDLVWTGLDPTGHDRSA